MPSKNKREKVIDKVVDFGAQNKKYVIP